MIDELHITGLGVIEDATLPLAAGLTVVTGETGAGKTMVVTALELLLGARADTELVRAGSEAAYAEARICPPPASARDWTDGDDELVVSREIPADGRSRARINGRLAPVRALAEALGPAVEVHGQHEHVRLGRPDVQRALLDRFAGEPHARALDAYRDTHRRWREIETRLEALDRDARERARESDRLRHEVAEIEAADLDVDVDACLDADVAVLEHAEELQQATARAAAALGSEGAGEPIGLAVDALRRIDVEAEELDALRERLTGTAAEVYELAGDLRRFSEAHDADPQRLALLHERQQLLASLLRKYADDVAGVLAYAEQATTRLAELDEAEVDAATLTEQRDTVRDEVHRLAVDVTGGRRQAAERLAEVVDGHLHDLAMPHARFSVDVEDTAEPGPHGADRVSFLLAANPGEPARPLAGAASGGERSRVSLAVEVALADVDDVAVLVFDEVDAGIGGATAMAVGEKLARLAARGGPDGTGRQVLTVTHLGQLAAFADVHHVVEKGIRDGRTVTTTRLVAADARVDELARMIGGDGARDSGREHARDLLAQATTRRAG